MDKKATDLWQIEKELRVRYPVIAGIDEAGRGPLAGPVVAAALILPAGIRISGLNDSKKLTETQRNGLFDKICSVAATYGIGLATEEEIDRFNILNATYLAMNRAIEAMEKVPDICLIDGNRADGVNYENQCLVKGDSKCACIAAASILAKVTRDRLMVALHEDYPQYGFDRHKGYPTRAHYTALTEHGPSAIHRKSFLRKWEAAQ